jgi:hypothetical protein
MIPQLATLTTSVQQFFIIKYETYVGTIVIDWNTGADA